MTYVFFHILYALIDSHMHSIDHKCYGSFPAHMTDILTKRSKHILQFVSSH